MILTNILDFNFLCRPQFSPLNLKYWKNTRKILCWCLFLLRIQQICHMKINLKCFFFKGEQKFSNFYDIANCKTLYQSYLYQVNELRLLNMQSKTASASPIQQEAKIKIQFFKSLFIYRPHRYELNKRIQNFVQVNVKQMQSLLIQSFTLRCIRTLWHLLYNASLQIFKTSQ